MREKEVEYNKPRLTKREVKYNKPQNTIKRFKYNKVVPILIYINI